MDVTFMYRRKVDFSWYAEIVDFSKDGHIYTLKIRTYVTGYIKGFIQTLY